MKTLMAHYREREAALRKSLDKAATVDDAVALLQQELTWLEGVMSGGLTLPQQRALGTMFEVLRASLRGLKEGVRLERVPQSRTILYDLVQGVLRMMGLGAAQDGAAVRALCRVRLDANAYLQHFAQGLTTVDRWLADQPTAAPQEDRRDLLEFLQRLVGDAHTGDTALLAERLEGLPQVMERYGIRYVYYDPATPSRSPAARRLFKFEPSLDPAQRDAQTLLPAVVQGDAVLFRGLVTEPA